MTSTLHPFPCPGCNREIKLSIPDDPGDLREMALRFAKTVYCETCIPGTKAKVRHIAAVCACPANPNHE
jgi:hypothetical protein